MVAGGRLEGETAKAALVSQGRTLAFRRRHTIALACVADSTSADKRRLVCRHDVDSQLALVVVYVASARRRAAGRLFAGCALFCVSTAATADRRHRRVRYTRKRLSTAAADERRIRRVG